MEGGSAYSTASASGASTGTRTGGPSGLPCCEATHCILLATVALALGCGDGSEQECVALVKAPLEGGGSSAAVLEEDSAQLRGVLRYGVTTGTGEMLICSATLVRKQLLLTAAHCLGGENHLSWIRHGEPAEQLPVVQVAVHPEMDLALIYMRPHPALELPTVPVVTKALEWTSGQVVQLAGYGTYDGPSSALSFAAEEIVTVGADVLRVSAFGFGGACNGDSGAPMLTRAQDGRVRVSAVLSGGHASCRGEDDYTRLDSVLDWLDANAASAPELDAVAGSCGALSSAGACHGKVAIYCDADRAVAASCAGAERCGWDAGRAGFRCIKPELDTCGGVDGWGECRDGIARRCSRGQVSESQCDACGGECVRSPRTGHATCF
jgi:hypothetical protein